MTLTLSALIFNIISNKVALLPDKSIGRLILMEVISRPLKVPTKVKLLPTKADFKLPLLSKKLKKVSLVTVPT